MGIEYFVVNLEKREMLKAYPFGDHEKALFASSNHANLQLFAIRWLLVPNYWEMKSTNSSFPLCGSWQGDVVTTVSDHCEFDGGESDFGVSTFRDLKDISSQVFSELLGGCDVFCDQVIELVQEKKPGHQDLYRTIQNIPIGSVSDRIRLKFARLIESRLLSDSGRV